MKRYVVKTIAAAAAAALLLSSCGGKKEDKSDFNSGWESIPAAETTGETAGSAPAGSGEGAPESAGSEAAGNGTVEGSAAAGTASGAGDSSANAAGEAAEGSAETTPADAQSGFTYADVAGMECYFSSGAGGWATYMTINADGSFAGSYHDSDMGDSGEGYPNGTLYFSEFTGSFGDLTKVDDYTYKTTLKSLNYANTPETEEIKDEIKYVYSEAYGLNNPADLYFYLPGKPVSELPEPFLSWVRMAEDTAENGKITVYGLYNENVEYGFGGYPAIDAGSAGTESSADTGSSSGTSAASLTADQLRAHVESAQQSSDELENRLNNEDMNQMTMNQVSADFYKVWDDQLNEIWGYLKSQLSEEEMQKLTDEQMKWISDKEAQVAAEGGQYEGGSIQPLVENRLAAQLTRDRVYELMEYVK